MGRFTVDSRRRVVWKRVMLMAISRGTIARLVGLFAPQVMASVQLGVDLKAFSPHAKLTVIEGRVERDDMSFFQVLTEAWRSTRVRVSIEGCTPLTAVIASFGAEPVPSRRDFLAHATLDLDDSGSCGVDIISRPSYIRDGVWHFAVVGGEPLLSTRNFAGPPDTLTFEAVAAAESAVYPTLDRGVADRGVCVRRISTPPVNVPKVRYSSSTAGGGASDIGFLPTVGRFPSDSARQNGTGGTGDDGVTDHSREAPPPQATSWPRWLGEFMVSARDEVVAFQFEVAALVDRKPAARREGRTYGTGSRRGEEFGGLEEDAGAGAGDPQWSGPDKLSERWGGRNLASQAERGKRGGNDFRTFRGLEFVGDGDRCVAGRWYVTARARCNVSSPPPPLDRDRLRRLGPSEPSSKGETMASTRGVAQVAYFASATDATVNSSASDWSRSRSESSPTGPSSATVSSSDTRSSASKFPVAEALFSGGRQGAEYPGLGKDAGWGLEVLSLQRDWAHVEWRADALVPDGSENGADPRTCPSEVGAQDAFELRAAVVTQVCPRGAVGVAGVDLRPLDGGGGSNSSSSGGHEVVRRFACVDTVLPMTESIHGDTHRIYEGRPRALSNLLFDEGGASDQQDGGAVDGEPSRWMWRGPQPPSVTYALDMSGRELGASVEIRLTVNSSVSARDASRSALDSPSAWRMGPYSAAASDDAGPGCVAGNGTLPPLEETSFNLTVAVRAGALPELDANGSAGEDTWVLRTSDVLREAVELAPCPSPLGGEYDREPKKSADASSSMELRGVSSAAAVSEDGTRRWSTVFKWNVTRPPPLRPAASGGSGIEKGDLATTLFVVIYADIGDKAGEEAGKEGSGVDDEDPLWALGVAPRVAFRYCTEDVCPADRGWCRPTLTSSGSDDYVTISKCHCFYGYGGESCSQRAVSLLSLVWKFVCLVCSNLAVIPGVRVALRLGMATGAAPALVLSLNGIASALYHMCDLELTCAAGLLTYSSLQALDFFFSFFSVAALVLHLCPMPWDEPLVPHPIPTSSTTAGVAAAEGESGGGRVLGDDAPAHGGCRPEEDESEDRVGGGQEEGEKKEGGTRLAALYACLTYPLLVAVTNGPTAGANLIAMFAICGALLVFSWGRLVARDSRGWWKEAVAKLDEERVDGDAEGIDGAGARGLEHGPPLDGAGEAVHAPAGRGPNALDTREDGQRGRRGRSRDINVGVVKRRNSSSPRRNAPLSDHGGTGGTGHGSPVGDLTEESFLIPLGDSSRVPDNSFGNSGGERSVEPSCLGPARVGRVRGVLRSLRRVTVDRGLLDWRQLGFGVAGFALGLTCFALEGAPATVKSYHLWHGAWHVLAMGSTVPLLRARRWGVVETLGGDDFYGRRYGAPVRLGWRARLHVCVRGCRVPNENRTYEMVPDRQPRDLPRRSER